MGSGRFEWVELHSQSSSRSVVMHMRGLRMAKTLQACRGKASGMIDLKDALVLIGLLTFELFVIIGIVQLVHAFV